MKKNPYQRFQKPYVTAHRGSSGHAPENTIPAFDFAAKIEGVAALETDIHATKDGVIMAAHDESVDRMTDGSGEIRGMTYEALNALDAGYRFEKDGDFPFRGKGLTIPTLGELFERYPKHIINIDIKQESPSIVKPFVELLDQYGRRDSVVVGSFHNETVAEFRRLAPDVATAGSAAEVRRFYILNRLGLSWFYRGKCVAFQIPEAAEGRQIVTPKFVENLHKHGVEVHVWTVNEPEDMRRLLDWGVDAVITDFPEVGCEVCGEFGSP